MNINWDCLKLFICKRILINTSLIVESADEYTFLTAIECSYLNNKISDISRLFLKLQEAGIISSLEIRDRNINPLVYTKEPKLILTLSDFLDKHPGFIKQNANEYVAGEILGNKNYGYIFKLKDSIKLKETTEKEIDLFTKDAYYDSINLKYEEIKNWLLQEIDNYEDKVHITNLNDIQLNKDDLSIDPANKLSILFFTFLGLEREGIIETIQVGNKTNSWGKDNPCIKIRFLKRIILKHIDLILFPSKGLLKYRDSEWIKITDKQNNNSFIFLRLLLEARGDEVLPSTFNDEIYNDPNLDESTLKRRLTQLKTELLKELEEHGLKDEYVKELGKIIYGVPRGGYKLDFSKILPLTLIEQT